MTKQLCCHTTKPMVFCLEQMLINCWQSWSNSEFTRHVCIQLQQNSRKFLYGVKFCMCIGHTKIKTTKYNFERLEIFHELCPHHTVNRLMISRSINTEADHAHKPDMTMLCIDELHGCGLVNSNIPYSRNFWGRFHSQISWCHTHLRKLSQNLGMLYPPLHSTKVSLWVFSPLSNNTHMWPTMRKSGMFVNSWNFN